MAQVTFRPSGVSVSVEPGTTVAAAAQRAGIALTLSCGGRGTCGLCAVRVMSGNLREADAAERKGLARGREDVRLGCLAQVEGDVELAPLFGSEQVIEARSVTHGARHAAVDLGTTTVAARIIDEQGHVQGSAVVANAQQSWGGDVLSRIAAANSGHMEDLRTAALTSVAQALHAAGASEGEIGRLVIAGNTAMAALLIGVDPGSLGQHPFAAPEISPAASLALPGESAPRPCTVLPPLASFVGGDVLAGIISSGMLHRERPEMLVDVGTNAEIVVRAEGRLWVASAAAGPAFEGAGISCGMPPVAGAVTRVSIAPSGRIDLDTIDDAAPAGLSGAGLVSAISALRGAGHLRADGLFDRSGPLTDRFVRDAHDVVGLVLDDGGSVVLNQLDVRTFQLAKAAVQVGVSAVLDAAGACPADISVLHLAGGFGSALQAEDLVRIGILPAGLARCMRYAGNGSLEGASAVALDPTLLDDALARIGRPVHVDLATSPGFARALIGGTELEATV